MNLVDRAKNILLTPKTEWPVIAGESATLASLLTSYVLPLATIPAIASIIAVLIVSGSAGTGPMATAAIMAYFTAVLSFVIITYVVDLLAGTFKSEKNINRSAQLVAYSSTASWVAGILTIIPMIGWLGSLAGGLYAIYLMYLGVGPMKKTPEDQKVVYIVVCFIVVFAVSFGVASVLAMLMVAGM